MSSLNRRRFLQRAASSAALGVPSRTAAQGVPVVIDLPDPVASAGPARWAARELQQALAANPKAGNRSIIAAGSKNPVAREILKQAGVSIPEVPESLGIVPGKMAGKPVLLASGFDTRGLVDRLPAIDAEIELMEKQVASGNAPKDQVAESAPFGVNLNERLCPAGTSPLPTLMPGSLSKSNWRLEEDRSPCLSAFTIAMLLRRSATNRPDMLLSGERYRIAIPGSYTGFSVPFGILFRGPTRAGFGVALPGLPARTEQPTLLCGASRIARRGTADFRSLRR